MEVAVIHILRGFALCLLALGSGLILDGSGVFARTHPQTLTRKLATSVVAGLPAGLRVEVVETLAPGLSLDEVSAGEAALDPCLPTPRIDLALLRPTLVRG
jgi:hypothetical protein